MAIRSHGSCRSLLVRMGGNAARAMSSSRRQPFGPRPPAPERGGIGRARRRRLRRGPGPASKDRAPASSSPIRSPDSRARAAAGSKSPATAPRPGCRKSCGQIGGARQRVGDRIGKGRIVPALADRRCGAGPIVRQQREQLPGHEGAEKHHLACADLYPFGVGAGQADNPVETRAFRQKPRDLGLLAAHHIGGLVLFDPGQNSHPKPVMIGPCRASTTDGGAQGAVA
jgi:hypothetical protein